MRRAKTNLLIMRYKLAEGLEGNKYEKFCPLIFSKVLLPTDFSEPAGEAISTIKEIEENVNEASKKLNDIKEEIGEGFNVKCHVRVGNPIEVIISTSEDDDVSLIAMSTHGKGWLRELLVGSTTCAVVRRANRPVLVVRSHKT